MSTNEKFAPGDNISLPVPAGTKSGAPLRIGGLNVITTTDVAKTDVAPTNSDGTRNADYNWGGGNPHGNASCKLDGAHEFVTAIAITNVGDPVYITSGNALSASSSGNQLYGNALTTKAGTSGPLTVRLAN